MYRAWNGRRATLRNCDDRRRRPGVRLAFLPLNRVALFAAQITRESLDTREEGEASPLPPGPRTESRHYQRRPYGYRSLSRHYEISLSSFSLLPSLSTSLSLRYF